MRRMDHRSRQQRHAPRAFGRPAKVAGVVVDVAGRGARERAVPDEDILREHAQAPAACAEVVGQEALGAAEQAEQARIGQRAQHGLVQLVQRRQVGGLERAQHVAGRQGAGRHQELPLRASPTSSA